MIDPQNDMAPKGSVLLVDDNPSNLKLLTKLLSEAGFQVRASSSGEFALQSIRTTSPSIILLDVVMPDLDGFEVCRRLKADPQTAEIPVIFISALKDEAEKVKGFEVGGVDFITKPFHRQEVLARVRTQVNLRCMQLHLQDMVEERTSQLTKVSKRFQRLFEQASDAFFVQDIHDGKIVDVNLQACRSLGYSKEELLQLKVSEVEIGIKPGQIIDICKKAATGERLVIEGLHRRKDGSSFPVEVSIGLFQEDEPMLLLAIARDISDRKRAEDELRNSKEQWERTFNAIPDIITVQDKEMTIVRANRAAYDLLGLEPENLLGKKCYEIFCSAPEPCVECPGQDSHRPNCMNTKVVHEKLKKVFHVLFAPILDKNNQVEHLVHVAKDITQQIKLEEELFQAHKLEAIGTLAGGVAHDFNNILSAIIGFAELAREEIASGGQPFSELNEVLQASHRAASLVKQILAFSRKGKIKRAPLQPSLVIKEAMKLLRASLPATVDIQMEISSENDVILADPTEIHQIIMNLCTNAQHAMENENGILKVKLVRRELTESDLWGTPNVVAGTFVELTVSDTGHGMNKATRDRIFEPYFTTKEVGKGSGLGLALVHSAVKSCGGMIAVESEPGKGAVFHVFFPVISEEAGKKVTARNKLPTGHERIMVLDDEPTIAAFQNAALSRLGYEVTEMISSEEALKAFRADPHGYDLLITDQTMPCLTGVNLAKELLLLRPDLPIILCTGYSATISEDEAINMGIKKFLHKPIDRSDLAGAVRMVLDEN